MMIKDNEAQVKLFSTVINLLFDDKRREELKSNIASYAVTDADELIATEIFKSLK